MHKPIFPAHWSRPRRIAAVIGLYYLAWIGSLLLVAVILGSGWLTLMLPTAARWAVRAASLLLFALVLANRRRHLPSA